MTALTKMGPGAALGAQIEQALIGGNLANLTPEQRVSYYNAVCESVGLNPLTRPFDYITLNGKLTLYARRDATDQLRKIHRVSVKIVSREVTDDVYVVTAQATDVDGRADESIGALSMKGLTGEAKANAMMKAETKAKRRVALSICGLGMLDETEVDSIPGASYSPPPSAPTDVESAPTPSNKPTPQEVAELRDALGKLIPGGAEARQSRAEWLAWATGARVARLSDLAREEFTTALTRAVAGDVPPVASATEEAAQ